MTIYHVPMPAGLTLVNSVQPNPWPAADGKWYFTVYGSLNGAQAVSYMLRWNQTMASAEFVPIEEHTNAQGTPAIGAAASPHMWLWSFQDKQLRVQIVPDWAPPAWMQSPPPFDDSALVARIAALEQLAAAQALAIAQIETELGNIGAGLETGDRAALDVLLEWIETAKTPGG